MPTDFLIDPVTKDLVLTGGRVNFTSERTQIARQRIESAIALVRGEYFLDLGAGVPWLELLRQKQVEPIQRVVTDVTLADPDVASASIDAERSGRAVTLDGVARLTSGEAVPITAEVG